WRRRGAREGFLEYLPRITTEETDWGLEITYTYDFGKYTSGISMPLLDRRGESWAWRVPIDDETHYSFNLTQDISKLLGEVVRLDRRVRAAGARPRVVREENVDVVGAVLQVLEEAALARVQAQSAHAVVLEVRV